MSYLLAALWPLFALILGGYLLRRAGFPSNAFWPGAERLNYFVLFPALLFSSLARAPLDSPHLGRIAGCVALILGVGWGVLLLLRRWRAWPASRFGVLVQGTLRFNTYIGLAAVGALFGEAGLSLMALLLAVTVPAVNTLSVLALTPGGSLGVPVLIGTLLRNPLILACIGGVMANLVGLPLGGGVSELLGLLAASSLPLGLLCVGAALQPQDLRRETLPLLINSMGRLLLMPLGAWLLSGWMGMAGMEQVAVVLLFALPCAPTAYVLARQLHGDAELMAGIITLQTLLAMLSLPLVLLLAL